MSLGRAIRERRLARDLTLVAVAERSGLSQPFLSQVENDRATPSVDSLQRIASALSTTPQALFGHHDLETIELTRWTGPWPADDKDANFKADVALYAKVDPLRTVRGLAGSTNVPEGAIVRWVLARWASEGASGLLELGPTMTRRLHGVCTSAEEAGDDRSRLAAYHQLRQMISWLNHPLDHPEVYDRD